MRIAQLAPLAESVPPKLYGGTERVIAWLVNELVELGHEVTLFASGDSETKGKLHAVWPRALRLGRKGADPNAACALLIEAIAERARDFDVIHSHVDWLPLPVLSRTGVPFLTTMHGRLDLPGLPQVIGAFADAPFVSISADQRRPLPEANWMATIQHGLPKDMFRPSYEPGSYLAFLGRLTAEKGPEDAIRIARGPDAAADRGQDPSGGDGLLQEQARAEHRWPGGSARRRGRRREEGAFPRERSGPAVSDRLARAVRSGDDRGDGLRDTRDRLSIRLGTGSRGGWRHGLYRRR